MRRTQTPVPSAFRRTILRSLPLLAMLVAISAPLCARAAAPDAGEERWYVLMMDTARAGWLRTAEATGKDGNIHTLSRMEFKLARGGAAVSITLESTFVETPGGEPVSMTSSQRLGGLPIMTRHEFGDDGVTVTSEQAGRATTTTAPLPAGEWMTPAAARRYVEQRLSEGATAFNVTTIDPAMGLQIYTSTYEVDGKTTVEAFGKSLPAVRWRVEQSIMPGIETVEYVSEAGETIRTDMRLGGITMTVLASERETALSPLEPAEIMANTLVKPNRPIPDARHVRRAAYRLRVEGGELPPPPTQGAQRVEVLDASAARVEVDAGNRAAASPDDLANPDFTGRSAMIDPTDEQIVELTRRALEGAGSSPADRAEAMRRFVQSYINDKSLDVGIASASEVCRTREGDCSEHAVLLAALLRADGIPSRVASGLIYIDRFLGSDNVFGYHMWTQALLEVDGNKRWVDLDATLPDAPFDAAHIALSVSSLAGGEMINSMAGLAPLLGRLEITVESLK